MLPVILKMFSLDSKETELMLVENVDWFAEVSLYLNMNCVCYALCFLIMLLHVSLHFLFTDL